MGMTQLKVIDK